MPTRCVIRGCKSGYPWDREKKKLSGVSLPRRPPWSLHRFPANPEIRNLWIEFVSIQNEKEYNHRRDNRLCSLHFSPDAFIDGDLKFRSVPTEFFMRHETSDQGWYVKPKAVSKPLQEAAENHDLEPDKILNVNTESDQGTNSDRFITCHSSPTASYMTEEMVDDPDPPEHQKVGSPVTTEEPIATQSSQQLFDSTGKVASRLGGACSKRSFEYLTVADFENPQKRSKNLKRMKDIAQDTLKKVKCSRKSASLWERKVSSLKDAVKELLDGTDDVGKKTEAPSNITEEKQQPSRSKAIPFSTVLQNCDTSDPPASLNNAISFPAKRACNELSSSAHLSVSTTDLSRKEAELENSVESTNLYQPVSTNLSVTQGVRSCTLFPRSGFPGNHQPILKEPNQAIKEEPQSSPSHKPSISDVVRGRRTINLGLTLEKFEKIAQHPIVCPSGRMSAISEDINSLQSIIRFMCYVCGKEAELEIELF